MAVINVDASYLEKKTNKKREEIGRILGLLGLPNELDGEKFVIEVTPNRPDCYLAQGIIRVINSYFKKNEKYKCKDLDYLIKVEKNIKKIRPYISACVIKNVELNDNEIEMLIDAQEKMHDTFGRKRKKLAIGIHNLDVINFPLIYGCVKEFNFTPLDFENRMSIGEILEKHPKGIEYEKLVLKGKYPLIYEENSKEVISFPPIINEERTKLKKGVKNIFIEVTGTHKESVESAMNILCCSIKDIGGEIYFVKINDEKHPKLEYKKEKINKNKINKVLGLKLNEKEISSALEKMGYFIEGKTILIPPYRADIINYIDIIEDIAIGYGYENFKPTIPDFYCSGVLGKKSIMEKQIREIMNGLGFIEVMNTVLVDKPATDKAIKIINPCTLDVAYLRDNLFESIMRNLNDNKMKGIPQKIYEIGIDYEDRIERKKISFGIMDKKIDFNEIKSFSQKIIFELGLKDKISFEKLESNKFNEGAASLFFGKEKIGEFGEVSKKELERRNIEFEIGFFEMNIN